MDINKDYILEKIQKEITNYTYKYFIGVDSNFNSYVYGDKYYRTLNEVIYSFIARSGINNEKEFIRYIDIVKIVTDLFAVYIKADSKYSSKIIPTDQRHRKNYVHKALRNDTNKLLKIEYCQYVEIISSDIDNPGKVKYCSLDGKNNSFVEDISYEKWCQDNKTNQENEKKSEKIIELLECLNEKEKSVIKLFVDGMTYKDISEKLLINKENVRKIFYRAKKKILMKVYRVSCCQDR